MPQLLLFEQIGWGNRPYSQSPTGLGGLGLGNAEEWQRQRCKMQSE